MRDLDIRLQLHVELAQRFSGDIIRGEFGLCLGQTRVDVAVVNGSLHGYEIKSERDNLARLPGQIEIYDRVLDYSTIVCGTRHLDRVAGLVPDSWGIIQATDDCSGRVALTSLRVPVINRTPDPLAIAQLLWRAEAAQVLTVRGERVKSKETRWDLWDRLAAIPLETLQCEVRLMLKERRAWLDG
jgi:hypothetical protein